MTAKIRLGLIGCGPVVLKRNLADLARSDRGEIVAVCAATEPSAQRVGEQLGVSWTTDHHALIGDPRVDAVIVASPHRLHASMTIDALSAGKHVLVDKPLATDLADLERVRAAAASSDRVIVALPGDDCVDPFLTLRTLVRPEIIGPILAINAQSFSSGPTPGSDWKLCQASAGAGALLAHGVYFLTWIAELLGAAKSVSAAGASIVGRRQGRSGPIDADIDDHWLVSMSYPSGQLASLSLSWACAWRQSVFSVIGHRGTVLYVAGPAGPPRLLVTPSPAMEGTPGVGPPDESGLTSVSMRPEPAPMIAHFLESIATGARPIASIERAVHVTELMLQAQASSQHGRTVSLSSRFEPSSPPEPGLRDLSQLSL